MYQKAHRLSIAYHANNPNNNNSLASFALIVSGEYDVYIVSEKALEIVGIIRNAQGNTSWLRYDHDISRR